jgi:hypothetical protein
VSAAAAGVGAEWLASASVMGGAQRGASPGADDVVSGFGGRGGNGGNEVPGSEGKGCVTGR